MADETTGYKEYASKQYVEDALASIDIPDVDLAGYATETYVDEAVAGIDIPEVSAIETTEIESICV